MQTRINDFVQVVRWDIRGHAHGDTRGAVDQQVGQARRENEWLALAVVVVGAKINGVLVDVAQHFVRNFGKTNLGITHRCRVITVHRAEIALAIDQHMA